VRVTFVTFYSAIAGSFDELVLTSSWGGVYAPDMHLANGKPQSETNGVGHLSLGSILTPDGNLRLCQVEPTEKDPTSLLTYSLSKREFMVLVASFKSSLVRTLFARSSLG